MLREVQELEVSNFAAFARDFPSIHAHVDRACEKLVEIGFYLNDTLVVDAGYPAFGSLLLGVHRSLAVSALRLLARDYDEGMMLLRMASEQARDLCVLLGNPLLFHLWKRYRTNRPSLEPTDWERFRKEFKFDLTSKVSQDSKWVYDHASEIGVHGAGIISDYYRKLPPHESLHRLNVLLIGLISLPSLCQDKLRPFIEEHAGLIHQKLEVPMSEFLLDLDVRYSIVLSHALIASQQVSEQIEQDRTK